MQTNAKQSKYEESKSPEKDNVMNLYNDSDAQLKFEIDALEQSIRELIPGQRAA